MSIINEKFLAKISKVHSEYAFRGQDEANWKLHSSATRRLIKNLDTKVTNKVHFPEIYKSYHCDELIEPARTAGFDIEEGRTISDLQLLSKLQHYGAATGLIDFTWSPLVALWFACAIGETSDSDGKVFYVNLNDSQSFKRVPPGNEIQSVQEIFPQQGNDLPLYWEPMVESEASARIIGQRSVFVIGRPLIPDSIVNEIEIQSCDKKSMRKELSDIFDISERSLFRDIHGFSTVNRADSPIRIMGDPRYYLVLGNKSYQQGDYDAAINNYGKCIERAKDIREPYFLRGNAMAAVQDYGGALENYDLGEHCKKLYLNWTPNTHIVNDIDRCVLLYNRGNVKAVLNDHKGALKDYDKVIQLNSAGFLAKSVFFNRANTKVILRMFDKAIKDYEAVINIVDGSHGPSGKDAQYNKGNVLVMHGCFKGALECYDGLLQEGNSNPHTAENRDLVERIIERIGSERPVIDYKGPDVPSGQPGTYRFQVLIKVAVSSIKAETYIFKGNKGNTGNFGAMNFHGGKGFPGNILPVVRIEGST